MIVTGASGFVGREVCRSLVAAARPVRALVRRPGQLDYVSEGMIEERVVVDLRKCADDPAIFAGADAIVHLAGRVHVRDADSPAAERTYQRDNVALTDALASAAASAGVSRFIFMSSIKALAERSGRLPLRPDDVPQPEDAYGRSKLAAERALACGSSATGLEVAVIRPPLVYGPDVRANFRALVNAVARGLPLPLGAVRNRRSLVSVWNVADFVVRCLGPLPSRYTLLHVADPSPVATPQLVRLIADALGRPARLLPVPPVVLSAALRVIGRGAWIDRLVNSLELDTTASYASLGWAPRLDVAEGIGRTVRQMRR